MRTVAGRRAGDGRGSGRARSARARSPRFGTAARGPRRTSPEESHRPGRARRKPARRPAAAAGPSRADPRAPGSGRSSAGPAAPRRRCDLSAPVRLPRVAPDAAFAAVVERRLALEHELDRSAHAPHRPQQHPLGLMIGRRAAMGAVAGRVVAPRADEHDVAHDRPARRGVSGRLEHDRTRQIAPIRRYRDIRRAQAKPSRVPVEDRREDTRAVHSRQAHPLHAAARRDQRAHLAIRDEPVVGDRREPAPAHRRVRPARDSEGLLCHRTAG
jgi:hypothetical protein